MDAGDVLCDIGDRSRPGSDSGPNGENERGAGTLQWKFCEFITVLAHTSSSACGTFHSLVKPVFPSNNPQLALVPHPAAFKVLRHRTSKGLRYRTCPRRNTINLTSRNTTKERIEVGIVEGRHMIHSARSDCRSLARAFLIPL